MILKGIEIERARGRGRKPRLDPEKYEEVKQAILECQKNLNHLKAISE
jgi:hypothetical protein